MVNHDHAIVRAMDIKFHSIASKGNGSSHGFECVLDGIKRATSVGVNRGHFPSLRCFNRRAELSDSSVTCRTSSKELEHVLSLVRCVTSGAVRPTAPLKVTLRGHEQEFA
jgi:hypothetical protein